MAGGGSVYTKANPAERAERAGIVFDLKLQGHSYREIDALTRAPDGPTGGHRISPTTAKELVYEESARRVDPRVDAWRAISLERLEGSLRRLDALEAATHAVLQRQHITVSNGRIIHLDGEPLPDDGPVLQAIDRLVKIEEARRRTNESARKLLGLDEPVQVQMSGGVTYEIVGVDMDKLR